MNTKMADFEQVAGSNGVPVAIRLVAAAARRLPVRGRTRAAWRLARALDFEASHTYWNVPMVWGGTMQMPVSSSQAWTAAFTGSYDKAEQRLLTSFIEPGTLVLDIGACFGLWTVPLAIAAQGFGGRLISFEPVPMNAEALRRNVAANHLSSVVEIHRVALGAEPGEAILNVESVRGGNAAIGSGGGLEPPGSAKATATIVRLDDLCIASSGRSVIKIDVEGYEMDVLEGGSRFITESRPVILGEFNPDWFQERDVPGLQLEEWTRQNNYVAYRVGTKRRSPLGDERVIRLELMKSPVASSDSLLLLPAEGEQPGDAAHG